MSDISYYNSIPFNTGWSCPLCNRVWSPTVSQCANCNMNTLPKWNFDVKWNVSDSTLTTTTEPSAPTDSKFETISESTLRKLAKAKPTKKKRK